MKEIKQTSKPIDELQSIDSITKISKLHGSLLIRSVSKAIAKDMIVKNHYSHKWNDGGFGVHNFGIFRSEEPDNCLGVAVYGYMKVPRAQIFTHPNPKAWISELNRMWIDDCLGKNAETILIAASLKLLTKADPNIVAVQSFADGRLGCGTIYKAANFRYFGYHNSVFLRNARNGEVTHQQILTNTTSASGYLRSNMAYLLGDLVPFSVKTYRYVYPLSPHFRLKFKEKPYPAYEKGETSIEWPRNREAIKKKIITLMDRIE